MEIKAVPKKKEIGPFQKNFQILPRHCFSCVSFHLIGIFFYMARSHIEQSPEVESLYPPRPPLSYGLLRNAADVHFRRRSAQPQHVVALVKLPIIAVATP